MTVANSGRQYRSALRQDQARRTRSAVLDAAGRLFVEQGYGATTMKEIAAGAGVSVESVYAQGSKASLLLACVDRSLVGDDSGEALLDREPLRELLATSDPEQWLRVIRDLTATRAPGSTEIFEAFRGAAAVDPKLAAQWQIYAGRRYADAARLVAVLAPHLRPGLTLEHATDVFWALVSPSMMLALCRERGWTSTQYADWLADSVRRLLLN
ncbi:helix-turn-helix domain-containing protein [Actinoplanes sp. NPDC051861]|uniref:TetR/AcrR family transcriptional regulator n=1 Tax=Actinoplanes sp. NPDC051861 TaxID=3155170 RepID=UPI0034203D88